MCFFASRGRWILFINKPKSASVLSHNFPFFPPLSRSSGVSITSSPFAFLLLWQLIHFVSRTGRTISLNTSASSSKTCCCFFSGRRGASKKFCPCVIPVSYTHLRAHETPEHLVCR